MVLRDLGLALAIGLLLGVQRGWVGRDVPAGGRVAGIRTFGLIGLIGGAAGLLGRSAGPLLPAALLLALAGLLAVGYWRQASRDGSLSITAAVSGLLAGALALVATSGWPMAAAAGAVVSAVLLSLRETLHRWVAALSEVELRAGLRFLLIAVVLLPLLPDRPMGPYGALNPFSLGSMVVLLAGLSFAGYWAVRLLGPRRGMIVTAAAGGLVSSTAVTLAMSRMARAPGAHGAVLAAAIVAASLVMVLRLSALIGLLAPALLPFVAPALLPALLWGMFWLWWQLRRAGPAGSVPLELGNPFELRPALLLTAMLAVLLVASQAARAEAGAGGLFTVTALTGLVDVDAVVVSMGQLVGQGLALGEGAVAVLLAVAVNTVVKAAMPWVLGARAVRLPVAGVLLGMVAAGAAGLAVAAVLRA